MIGMESWRSMLSKKELIEIKSKIGDKNRWPGKMPTEKAGQVKKLGASC